jgi:hypothetical protein
VGDPLRRSGDPVAHAVGMMDWSATIAGRM